MSVITTESVARPLSTSGNPGERPRLVLVPTGADAVGLARTAPRPALRMTRRGRLAVAFLVALVVGAAAVIAGGGFASATGEARTVTVHAGQTLSEVAAASLPELTISDAIVEIQIANSLSTDQVHAGQTLRIPAG